MSLPVSYFPSVRPSAIVLGTVFEHVSSFIVYGPLFGQTWQKAMNADKNSEFWKSKEAENAAVVYGTSLVSAGIQTYAIAALIQLTGTVSYKGAASLGALVFGAQTLPSLVTSLFYEKRPSGYVTVRAASGLLQTLGLALILVGYGTRRSLVS